VIVLGLVSSLFGARRLVAHGVVGWRDVGEATVVHEHGGWKRELIGENCGS
jgi:hypothetical protein